jgi:hypothetical protein
MLSMLSVRFVRFAVVTAIAVLAAGGAQADIVASGSAPFSDDAGFFLGTKGYTVYTADDPGNPSPGPAGSFTYVYTLNNDPGSFVGLIGSNIEVKENSVTAGNFGWIDAPTNPTPVAATLSTTSSVPGFDTVRFDWSEADSIAPGAVGDQLYIISTYSPGTVTDNIYSVEGQFASDETSSCVGPFTPPAVVGEPIPCTIGFWKNRYDEKNGTLQWFPDGEFPSVVSAALALSGGVFTSATIGGNCAVLGFNDLLCALGSKGARSIAERGRQQLAATYLNLAAGNLFPSNLKCKLFTGNQITSNACGSSITIGTAVNQATYGIQGTADAQADAHACSDDINNGIGVIQ